MLNGNPKYKTTENLNTSVILFDRFSDTKKEVILVESAFSCFYAQSIGIKNIICSLGSNLSKWQIDRLRDYKKVIHVVDTDIAGKKMALNLAKQIKRKNNI